MKALLIWVGMVASLSGAAAFMRNVPQVQGMLVSGVLLAIGLGVIFFVVCGTGRR